MSLCYLSATQAVEKIRAGEISAEALMQDSLERIQAVEDTVQAWAFLDSEYALQQAREADRRRQAGRPTGPLHGIPVGVKDIFDTHDMPTEDGTVLHQGRRPGADATAVALLRQAGAIIMGKTVTAELATYAPGKTTNPHDAMRTPGGSSSGSAAAVAACMVPLAIGTQTNGSVIRPASYCGVYGYKPSHGLISRHRILQQSRTLDQVGVFARTSEDAALIAGSLIGFDEWDPDTRPQARPRLSEVMREEPPVPPRLAFVKSPVWGQADADTQAAFAELNEHLADRVEEVTLPEIFEQALTWHCTIMEADIARSFAHDYEHGRERMSSSLQQQIERGRTYLAVDYNDAVGGITVLNQMLEPIFQRYDAILTPAATGEAPMGLETTGDPIFCTLWTLCGLPAITLPILQGSHDMPMGAQLVAAKGDDARLLRTARWLVDQVVE